MKPSEMTHEQLADWLKDYNSRMCESGGRDWSLRIPADESDPDMMLSKIEACLRAMKDMIPMPKVEVINVKEDGYPNHLHINGNLFTAYKEGFIAQHARLLLLKLLSMKGGEDVA